MQSACEICPNDLRVQYSSQTHSDELRDWTNIARVNHDGIFRMHIVFRTHLEVFGIFNGRARSCGAFTPNIESHHFLKCAWHAYSISRYIWPVAAYWACILHSEPILMCFWSILEAQLQGTASEHERRFVNHFTSSLDPWTRSKISDTNIARVNHDGLFRMHIAFRTHLDVFVIDIVPATSCGVFNSNIESHHFLKCVWYAYSISHYV
jgi:hypothetical protein